MVTESLFAIYLIQKIKIKFGKNEKEIYAHSLVFSYRSWDLKTDSSQTMQNQLKGNFIRKAIFKMGK